MHEKSLAETKVIKDDKNKKEEKIKNNHGSNR